MKLFEFEAKSIFRKYGIATPIGRVVESPAEAREAARQMGKAVVLKAQVLAGGRGKAGGIQFANDPNEAEAAASRLIGSSIKGIKVNSLLLEEKLSIANQYYTGITIDRQARRYVVLASADGGVDIEEVAASSPERIARYWIEPGDGLSQKAAESVVAGFPGLSQDDVSRLASIAASLYKVVQEYDAELVEINPLVKTAAGDYVAADARLVLDDNALFRHPEFEGKDTVRVDDTPWEARARRKGLAYVDLEGSIGIIGNGAGLVMATMDLVSHFGGSAANFLDIGGGARPEVIKDGLILVMSKAAVKAVLINILGGITRCDLVAQGVIEALTEIVDKKPVVVRMMGTNEREGMLMLGRAGVGVYSDMEAAAREALRLSGGSAC
jgi:succinyl-CoA synthetase beta subunit